MHLQTKRVTARSDGLFVGNLQVITVILPEAASTRFRIFVVRSAPKTYGFNEVRNSCYYNSLFAATTNYSLVDSNVCCVSYIRFIYVYTVKLPIRSLLTLGFVNVRNDSAVKTNRSIRVSFLLYR